MNKIDRFLASIDAIAVRFSEIDTIPTPARVRVDTPERKAELMRRFTLPHSCN